MEAAETVKWTPRATLPYFFMSSRNAIVVAESRERSLMEARVLVRGFDLLGL